jgi:hypothetical protein
MSGTSWTKLARFAIRARPDYAVSVTHWTRGTVGMSAFEVLRKIIRERRISPSTSESGFIKANQQATCFTESPVSVFARLFDIVQHDPDAKEYMKWEPYGLSFLKPVVYEQFKGRPVLYLSDDEYQEFIVAKGLVDKLAWRVVEFNQNSVEECVDWTHEREWRVPGVVVFDGLSGAERPVAVVKSNEEKDALLSEFPSGDMSPLRGAISMFEARVLG